MKFIKRCRKRWAKFCKKKPRSENPVRLKSVLQEAAAGPTSIDWALYDTIVNMTEEESLQQLKAIEEALGETIDETIEELRADSAAAAAARPQRSCGSRRRTQPQRAAPTLPLLG